MNLSLPSRKKEDLRPRDFPETLESVRKGTQNSSDSISKGKIHNTKAILWKREVAYALTEIDPYVDVTRAEPASSSQALPGLQITS